MHHQFMEIQNLNLKKIKILMFIKLKKIIIMLSVQK